MRINSQEEKNWIKLGKPPILVPAHRACECGSINFIYKKGELVCNWCGNIYKGNQDGK